MVVARLFWKGPGHKIKMRWNGRTFSYLFAVSVHHDGHMAELWLHGFRSAKEAYQDALYEGGYANG